ncbi:MAG: BolA family transcriptional regulator, partial [Silvanigrellaceae bacterium]|nr:BolA family transcriptional regulator [Silvanigrellaceae bacterium]
EAILSSHLQCKSLDVLDESHSHHVPAGAETHFKVIMAAEEFKTLSRLERHRLINKLLRDEFDQGLHALSLYLYTPEEWQNKIKVPDSPACRDGYRHS